VKTLKLGGGVEIRSVFTDLFETLTEHHAKTLFDDAQYFFRPREYYSNEETKKLGILKQNLGQPLRLNLGAFHQDDLIGWSWGIQESAEVFYMVNSAVLPAYRRKGIYSELISTMVKEVSGQGFQLIYSKHVATNNAVLIPKLKAGFTISAFELSDQYGVLVHLRWYANPLRRKMMDFRAGGIGADGEIKEILNRHSLPRG